MMNSLLFFEKKYFNFTKSPNFEFNFNNYYEFLNDNKNELLVLNIFERLKKIKHKTIDTKFSPIIDLLKNKGINFTENNFIKNERELLFFYCSIFISKRFLSYHFIESARQSKARPPFQTSDDLINQLSFDMNSLIIWLELVSKEKILWYLSDSRVLFSVCLYDLTINQILDKKNIRINKKTFGFYTLKLKHEPIFYEAEIYIEKFNLYNRDDNIYQYNNHYSSVSKILKENPFSGERFDWKDIENFTHRQINENWLILSTIRIQQVLSLLSREYNINLSDIEKKYNEIIEKLINLIKRNDIKAISEISKKIPLYHTLRRLLILERISNLNIKIYIPFFKDFRGRKYDMSTLSLTFYRELRYVVHRGEYKSNEILQHVLINPINHTLDNNLELLSNWNWLDTKNLSIDVKRNILWILIAAGEPKKNKLGKEVHISQFIKQGMIELEYFNENNSLDIEDKLKLQYLEYIIKDIVNGSNLKWLIPKDATASCFQHLIKTLGGRTEDCFKWCNLQSEDTWYDTYSFIIDSFLKQIKSDVFTDDQLKDIFNRKRLKRTIMTENYGASEATCERYFFDELDCEKYSPIELNELKLKFSFFYDYLTKNDTILQHSSELITQHIVDKENYKITLRDGSIIDHKYLKHITTSKETRYLNKRLTRQHLKFKNKPDKQKMKQSARANYIQSLDALLVRWYLSKNWAVTIHDCFLIDYKNVSFLVAKLNEGMNLIFHDLGLGVEFRENQIFSIFIVI